MRTLVTTCFLWCCAMLCSTSLWAVPQSAASAMSKPTQLLFLVSQRNAETVAEAARRVAQLHPDIRIQARTEAFRNVSRLITYTERAPHRGPIKDFFFKC